MRTTNCIKRKKRRKKWLKKAQGSFGINHRSYRNAKQTVLKASKYAYRDRKNKKRTFRSLWILRINGGLKVYGCNYAVFMKLLKQHHIIINRKMLSEMAIHHPQAFKSLIDKVMFSNKTAL